MKRENGGLSDGKGLCPALALVFHLDLGQKEEKSAMRFFFSRRIGGPGPLGQVAKMDRLDLAVVDEARANGWRD